jgi:magnesium transporter
MLLAVCHSEATGWTNVSDLDTLSDLREKPGNLLWAEADVTTLGEADVLLIAEEFGLHPLAVEDAIHTRQRPKLDIYETHAFAVVHELDEIEGQLEASQLAFFIGERYVLTLHDGAHRILDEAKRRWEELGSRTELGPSPLIHTILDALVDDYQDIADQLETEIENIEEVALEMPNAPLQRQLYSLKQKLTRLRRYALPASRILDWYVAPSEEPKGADETLVLFHDVRDHLLRISDQIRNVDDLAQAVLDLTRAEQAQALNEVTKRLTGWAAVIAVPTFIASVYGMNFELVPESGKTFGFFFAVSLMVVTSVFLYVFFKRRNWI